MVLKLLTSAYLLAAIGVSTAMADTKKMTVIVHTGDEAGFLVNSYILAAENEAILIDTQFTLEQTNEVVKKIKASGVKLKAVFVTHAHPDHYFGLDTVLKAFPEAKAYARKSTVEQIRASGQAYIDTWRQSYGDKVTDKLIVPDEYDVDTFDLGGIKLQLIDIASAESESSLAIYEPGAKRLFAGDLLYSEVHLWLAEKRPEQWIKELKQLAKSYPATTYYPGHGAPGGQDLVNENLAYIENFARFVKQNRNSDEVISAMKKKYPNYKLDIILSISANAYFPAKQH